MAKRPEWDKILRSHFTTPVIWSLVMLCGVFLNSCSQQILPFSRRPGGPPALQSMPSSTSPARPARTSTTAPAEVLTPAPTSSPAARLTRPSLEVSPTAAFKLCQPLAELASEDLRAAVSNPFNPPAPGSDDPHQGVDLAIQQNGIALDGGRVQAVLPGVVAAVIRDRFPYGNAILIETPFQDLSPDLQLLFEPPVDPTPSVRTSLTCPLVEGKPFPEGDRRSLYLLYAHLQVIEAPEVGDTIGCGAGLGTVGQSGNALNPHLHLEVRAGPAGARFESLANYVTYASSLEMSNYCLWRVSGVFRLVNPLQVLEYHSELGDKQ